MTPTSVPLLELLKVLIDILRVEAVHSHQAHLVSHTKWICHFVCEVRALLTFWTLLAKLETLHMF